MDSIGHRNFHREADLDGSHICDKQSLLLVRSAKVATRKSAAGGVRPRLLLPTLHLNLEPANIILPSPSKNVHRYLSQPACVTSIHLERAVFMGRWPHRAELVFLLG